MILGTPACGLGDAGAPTTAKVAFLQDLNVPDHVELVSQAYLALADRLQGTVFEVIQFDGSTADAAAEAVGEITADPSYVLAVIAPFVTVPADAIESIRGVGVPVVALSTAPSSRPASTAGSTADGAWLPWVAGRAQEAGLAARLASERADGGPVCVAAARDPWSAVMGADIAGALGDAAVDLGGLAAAMRAHVGRCPVLVWAGFSDDAVVLRAAMPASIPLVVTDAAQTSSFLAAAPEGTVSLAACACVDLTTSYALNAQRFLNAFQASNGLAPGVYAAETWDLAGLVLATPGARRRATLNGVIGGLSRYQGVAGVYRFGPGPGGDGIGVHAVRAVGSRWVPEAAPKPPA